MREAHEKNTSRKRFSSTESEYDDFEDTSTDWAPSSSDSSEIEKKKRKLSKVTSARRNTIWSQSRRRICNKIDTPKKTTKPTEDNGNDFFYSTMEECKRRLHSKFQEITSQHNAEKTETLEILRNNQLLLRDEMIYLCTTIDSMKKQMITLTAGSPSDLIYNLEPERHIILENMKRNNKNQAKDYDKNNCKKNIIRNGAEMKPIGSGKTLIPQHLFNQLKLYSFKNATRKLLIAVFPRRTLATHSLTGKTSPAFAGRLAKMQLDAKKISDIVITVTNLFNVSENQVRHVITVKCSDENKMYRQRQKRREKISQETEDQEKDPETD